jgi:hypothetical protein
MAEIKGYMRAAGGAKAVAVTNSGALFEKYCSLSERALNTPNDIFLDVVQVNRLTGDFENSHAFYGGDWQMSEAKEVKFVIGGYGEGIARSPPLSGRDFNSKEENGAAGLFNENIFIKEKAMPDQIEKESKTANLMSNIAWDIVSLKSHSMAGAQLNWKNAHYRPAFDAVNLYRAAFGDEGLAFLENESGKLMEKYGFEKPGQTGLQEIEKFTDRLDTMLYLKQNLHLPDRKAHYHSFMQSEKEAIDAFMAEKQKEPGQARNPPLSGRDFNSKEQTLPNSESTLKKANGFIENNSTVEPDGSLRVKGLSEFNRNLNKGKPFFGDILEFAVTHDRLPTDAEIAEMPKQGENPPLSGRDINSKENHMSDVFEDLEEKELSPQQLAAMNAAYQRKVVADAIKAGTLACLPGADGYADTRPAVNIMSIDRPYHGANLLFLKEHQNQEKNGFPTAEYITYQQIENAKKDIPDLYIRQGQKGVSLHASERNEETGEWEEKHIRLFNVAQVNKPDELKKWAEQKREERAQERLEYLQKQYGTGYRPPEPKPRENGPGEIVCSSTEPEKYLGQYFAAVSLGSKFKATPEQAAEFSDKMVNSLYDKWINPKTGEPFLGKEGQPITNPYKLEDISREANKECRDFIRDLRMATQKQNQPKQKLEQQQSQGRGM